MYGKIIKIDQLKESRNKNETAYIRVYFQMREIKKDGIKHFWAKTDLVPKYRNYSRWSPFLKVGNVLSNLQLKKDNTVDADSYPRFEKNNELSEEQKEYCQQLKLLS